MIDTIQLCCCQRLLHVSIASCRVDIVLYRYISLLPFWTLTSPIHLPLAFSSQSAGKGKQLVTSRIPFSSKPSNWPVTSLGKDSRQCLIIFNTTYLSKPALATVDLCKESSKLTKPSSWTALRGSDEGKTDMTYSNTQQTRASAIALKICSAG